MVWLALDRLERARLLRARMTAPAKGIMRRAVIRKLGLGGALAALLPVVTTIIAPTPAMGQSPALGSSCTAAGGKCLATLGECRNCNGTDLGPKDCGGVDVAARTVQLRAAIADPRKVGQRVIAELTSAATRGTARVLR